VKVVVALMPLVVVHTVLVVQMYNIEFVLRADDRTKRMLIIIAGYSIMSICFLSVATYLPETLPFFVPLG